MKRISLILEQPKPFRYVIGHLLYKLKLCHFFRFKVGKANLIFHPNPLSRNLWIDSDARSDDKKFLKDFLKAHDTFIDVGANIGSLTLFVAGILNDTGIIYSFEPHPRTFGFLVKNININNFTNIRALNLALGDREGIVKFSDLETDDTNKVLTNNAEKFLEVPITTLNKVLKELVEIQLLKIDVEGFEFLVLSGADEVLPNIGCVYFEACNHIYENFNYTQKDIFQLLYSSNFTIFKLADNILEELNEKYISEKNENLIAIKDLNNFLRRTRYKLKNQNI